jgi:SET domain-containing protein
VTYRPLPDYLTIKTSPINGLGVFTTEKILAGTYIGIVHVVNENDPDGMTRTPLGGFGNHSDTPNCFKIQFGEYLTWLGALRDIEPDEEITWTYTLYNID